MFRIGPTLALIAALSPSPSLAQRMDEAARARAAVQRGEILRLSEVLPKIRDQFDCEVLDAFLVANGSSYTYRLSILTRDGRLADLLVDAATGRLIGVAPDRRGTGREGTGSRGDGGGQGGSHDDDDDDDDNDDDPDDGDGDDGGGGGDDGGGGGDDGD